jgi:HK97 family phage major capsid protein
MEKQLLGAKKIGKDQAEAEGKLNRLEQIIKVQDDTIKSQSEHLEKIESEFRAKRFGLSGHDSLVDAVPEDHRRWISFVECNRKDDSVGRATDNDAVKRIAIGSWFHSAIRAKLAAVQGNQLDASKYYERMQKLTEALGGVSKASLQEDTAIEGGNIVPTITEAVLGRVIYDNSVIRKTNPTMIQMTAKTHNLPSWDNNFTAYIVAEEGTVTDGLPTTAFGSNVLTARKFAGLATVSMELLEDNIVNVSDFLLTHIGEMIARKEDSEALEGTSVTGFTGGLGTNTSVNTFSHSTDNGVTTAPPLKSTTVNGLTTLVKTVYYGVEAHTRENARWWVHPWISRDAIQLTTGSAGSPWFPMVWQNQILGSSLLGFPVHETSVISKGQGTSTNESYIYFGNPRGLVVGDRAGTRFDVDPYGLFNLAQVRLRIIKRTGLLVWVPTLFTKVTGVKCT